MELAQDKIDLITKIIKNNCKFKANEDLYEDFFNETCKRSIAIINAVDSEITLESYIKRIATTSILNVLKDTGRLRRTREGYKATKEILINPSDVDYTDIVISYSDIDVPSNPEEIVMQKEFLEFVADTVKQIDDQEPEKGYLNLYILRYDKGMTQKEISEELDISQSEVSKRLYKLMEKVKGIIK